MFKMKFTEVVVDTAPDKGKSRPLWVCNTPGGHFFNVQMYGRID